MQMLIDGRWVDARDGKTRVIRNPGSGEVIDTVPMATMQDVDAALKAACAGSAWMRATPAHARSSILARAADIIASRKEELAKLLARENGKPIRQTR
ncbi:MAG TPA: aldehyde dehydrogenase family protein, partial [Spirochaetia bacterium]|nr:aldehyde dehydrogenase family protein [Spirochaetia bacterium]